MSTSSASAPAITVVVGSNDTPGAVATCLDALAPQIGDGVEVLVVEPVASPADVQRRYPFARFLVRPGALVPELWRDGIDAARGDIVALTISPMQPASDWVDVVLAQHTTADAVAGAIEPGTGLRLRDWAEYFCRYAPDMLPFAAHECVDLPGDNAAYRRAVLEETRDLYRDGFWEPVVHRRLKESGRRLWHTPELVVRQGRSAGFTPFLRQRYLHGRAHGMKRGERYTTGRNVAGILGSPLVPPLLTFRVLREVLRRGRCRTRVLLSVPLLLVFDTAWAAGEAVGHVRMLRDR